MRSYAVNNITMLYWGETTQTPNKFNVNCCELIIYSDVLKYRVKNSCCALSVGRPGALLPWAPSTKPSLLGTASELVCPEWYLHENTLRWLNILMLCSEHKMPTFHLKKGTEKSKNGRESLKQNLVIYLKCTECPGYWLPEFEKLLRLCKPGTKPP